MAANVKQDIEAGAIIRELDLGGSVSADVPTVLEDMLVYPLEDTDSDDKASSVIMGVFLVVNLSVVGEDNSGSAAIAIGEKVYLDSSEYNKDDVDGTQIGYALGAVTSGATTTIPVGLTRPESLTVSSGVTASAAEINVLDGVTGGTVVASKALVVDANKDLATLRHLTISGNLITGSTTLSEAELGVLDGVTPGTVAAGEAIVVDANIDFSGVRHGTFTGTVTANAFAGDITGDVAGDVTGTLIGGQQDDFTVHSGDGAITVAPGTILITKGSAAALTLANPTPTTHDGYILRIVSTTAYAHTIDNSAGAGFNGAGGAGDVLTLGGAKGDGATLVAYQGVWYIASNINATPG